MNSLPDFDAPIETVYTRFDLLSKALLNKVTAFSESERDMFLLHELIPPHVGTLDEQVARRSKVLRAVKTDFERYAFLRDLQDRQRDLVVRAACAEYRAALRTRRKVRCRIAEFP